MDSDDDDIYPTNEPTNEPKVKPEEDAEEEGEEVEDDSDVYSPPEDNSDAPTDGTQEDINFITDAKEEPKPEPKAYGHKVRSKCSTDQRRSQNKQRQTSGSQRADSQRRSASPLPARASRTSQSAAVEIKPDPSDGDTRELPPRHTSKLDPNSNPVHPATGKPILSTDFDTDFSGENSKPWRRPGADITDYFNYGFDEFTWASYCLKQKDMPKEVKAINSEAEQMKAFVEGIGGPGMPGVPTGPSGGQTAGGGASAGGMGMSGMPSESDMQQMFQAMMAQGMDPSQMDQNTFMQSMMGMGMGGGMQGGPPAGPSGFGGGDGGFQGGGGGYGGGGGGRGRGRRGRGNW